MSEQAETQPTQSNELRKLSKNQKRRQRLKAKTLQDELTSTSTSSSTAESSGLTSTSASNSAPPTKHNDGTAHPDTKTLSKDKILKIADAMWLDVKNQAKTNKTYTNMKDKEKLEFFRNKMGHAEFMTEYPIVARYMVCYGQYSTKAFSRMLDKLIMTKHPETRPPGYMEDQWIRRQADYVQYLWEAYQTRHHNNAERQYIWQESYKRLKGEFDDFRNMHKEIEERVKHEKRDLAAKNARELLLRIGEQTQKISSEETTFLLSQLQRLSYKKMMSNCMNELLVKRVPIPAAFSRTSGAQNYYD
jgi:hypothetical protein